MKTKTLNKRIALVAGGAGEVGEGIVGAMLHEGARVIVPSRDSGRLERLRKRIGEKGGALVTVKADIGTAEGAEALREQIITDMGALDIVVVSLGGWWRGSPLMHMGAGDWKREIRNNLTAHYIVARTFLPMLLDRPGSSYTMLNGPAALTPLIGSGVISIAAAAQTMMKEVLSAECAGALTRINTVMIMTPVLTRSRASGPASWLRADEVGEYVAWLASDDAAEVRGATLKLQSREQLPL